MMSIYTLGILRDLHEAPAVKKILVYLTVCVLVTGKIDVTLTDLSIFIL